MPKKTTYDPKFCRIAEEVYSMGGVGKNLEEALGVSHKTIHNWKQKHPELKDAIGRGKDFFNRNHVEKALLKRAMGYTYTNTTEKYTTLRGKKEDGTEVELPAKRITKTKKTLPPDVTSIIFYLVNRYRSDDNPRWVNLKQVQEHTGTVKHAHNHKQQEIQQLISGLPKDELKKLGEILFSGGGSDIKRVEDGDSPQQSEKVYPVYLENGGTK